MTGNTGIHEQLIDDRSGGATVSGLSIIGDELMETLRSAHLALEDCVDGRGGSAALVRAGELLHQARGALQLTETYGAALLAEEMELGCKYGQGFLFSEAVEARAMEKMIISGINLLPE